MNLIMQPHAARRSMLSRQIVSIVNRSGPLSAEDRKRLSTIREEMDSIEGEIQTAAQLQVESAFRSYLRYGLERTDLQPGVSEEERAVLREGSRIEKERRDLGTGGEGAYPQATSGFFAPVGFAWQVTSALKFYGCLFDTSTIWDTVSGSPMGFPADNDATISGELTAENQQFASADIPISLVNLKSYKFSSKFVVISTELAMDVGFPLDAYLADRFGIRLARVAHPYFSTGTGSGQPSGILPAAGSAVTAAGSFSNDGVGLANTIGSDDLVNLEKSVDVAYRAGAAYMMHANTWAALKKLKDKQGRPIYSLADAGMVNGYPVKINNDMAQLQTQASSPPLTNSTVAFGQLRKFVIRRAPLIVQRLVQRFADQGKIAYLAVQRMDGALIDGCAGGSVALLQNVY